MNDTFVKKIIPKLQPEEIITFLWDDNTVLHRHSDWEFTSTMDGTGINVVNGEEYPLMPGIFVLLGPKHVHRYYSDAPIKRHDICVPDEKMRQLADILQPDLYKKLSSSEKPIIIKLSVESFNEIHERLSKIDLLGQDNRDVRAILVSIVMYLLGVYLEHKSEKNMPKSVILFLQRISDPDVFSMRINDIIGFSSYSHSQFIKIFKTYVGKTIIEYVTDLRIAHAAKLLSSTDLKVITIASKVGYDNQSFFAQKFKDRYNVSPVEYRRATRKET